MMLDTPTTIARYKLVNSALNPLFFHIESSFTVVAFKLTSCRP